MAHRPSNKTGSYRAHITCARRHAEPAADRSRTFRFVLRRLNKLITDHLPPIVPADTETSTPVHSTHAPPLISERQHIPAGSRRPWKPMTLRRAQCDFDVVVPSDRNVLHAISGLLHARFKSREPFTEARLNGPMRFSFKAQTRPRWCCVQEIRWNNSRQSETYHSTPRCVSFSSVLCYGFCHCLYWTKKQSTPCPEGKHAIFVRWQFYKYTWHYSLGRASGT